MAAAIEWVSTLRRWSDAILASGDFHEVLSPNALAANWAGFPPASEEAIQGTEQRLGHRLPDSYRQFLRVSNGWWLEGTAGPTRLWSVEEVGLLSATEPDLVEIWSHLPDDVLDEADSTNIPPAHFASLVQISEKNDGLYLLNPMLEPVKGEWQAAFFANWVPGAECRESFGSLMASKFQAFLAAHSAHLSRANTTSSKPCNLARPPEQPITDVVEFLDILARLGYFAFVTEDVKRSMMRDFCDARRAFNAGNQQLQNGPFPSPGSVLMDPRSGRVVDLDTDRLARERADYALPALRPLLAKVGVELGNFNEHATADAYAVTLDGITHQFFRLIHGRPALQGGEHDLNAARYVAYETNKLVNKVLAQRASPARIATLEELRCAFPPSMRLGFVLLDDDLSYLLTWSPVIHNYCRPVRPDIR